jgi:hypothetical protein
MAVVIDAEETFDLANPIDIPDIIFTVLHAVESQLLEIEVKPAGQVMREGYLTRFWNWISRTDVELTQAPDPPGRSISAIADGGARAHVDAADRKCANTRAHVDAGDMEIANARRSCGCCRRAGCEHERPRGRGRHGDRECRRSCGGGRRAEREHPRHGGAGSMKIVSAGAQEGVSSKLDAAILRTQAKTALTGLGWKPAIAHAASLPPRREQRGRHAGTTDLRVLATLSGSESLSVAVIDAERIICGLGQHISRGACGLSTVSIAPAAIAHVVPSRASGRSALEHSRATPLTQDRRAADTPSTTLASSCLRRIPSLFEQRAQLADLRWSDLLALGAVARSR